MSNIKYQKPFLKWAGGKTQILSHVISKAPKTMENYHEIFLGGGSVLLAMLTLAKNKQITIHGEIFAYDINIQLINVYTHIQKHKDELFTFINLYRNEYDSCPSGEKGNNNRKPKTIEEAKTAKESYYYWLREKFNNMDNNCVENSALFIILNKLCFRGIYREGPNGFNVPYGHYKKTPQIITKEEIDTVSDLIKNVVFISCDFTDSINHVSSGDYVYLDPPYAPETKTSFVGYTDDGFNINKHKDLFILINNLDKKNAKFVMSNANVALVRESFIGKNITIIQARRACNSKNPAARTTELLIAN